ncbi:hypothetical protein Catovirus_2_62 [Catovirus CTV1]|uniref:Uncharacterized protein n=1 Tax=Catovirus CTV1 TaxID=1977631 RepID=A0A1V0SBN2_9VIRU|nr:hypothetical protein Catovirus_2_62 [Catovirus CTV1]
MKKNRFLMESCNSCNSSNIESFDPQSIDSQISKFESNTNVDRYRQDFDTYIAPYMYPPKNDVIPVPIPADADLNYNLIPNTVTYLKSEELNSPTNIFQNLPTMLSCCLCCIILIFIATRILKINL